MNARTQLSLPQSGFTLIEMIMVVAMLGIMVSLAVPGMRGVIANNRATTAVNELIASISLARSEAAMRGVVVSVCAVTTVEGSECAKPSSDVDWAKGWIVFTDQDGTRGEVDANDEILRRFAVDAHGNSTLQGATAFLSYQPSGLLLGNPVAWKLRAANCTKSSNRDVNLSATGRPSTKHVDC